MAAGLACRECYPRRGTISRPLATTPSNYHRAARM
jgi:hypothetical protein